MDLTKLEIYRFIEQLNKLIEAYNIDPTNTNSPEYIKLCKLISYFKTIDIPSHKDTDSPSTSYTSSTSSMDEIINDDNDDEYIDLRPDEIYENDCVDTFISPHMKEEINLRNEIKSVNEAHSRIKNLISGEKVSFLPKKQWGINSDETSEDYDGPCEDDDDTWAQMKREEQRKIDEINKKMHTYDTVFRPRINTNNGLSNNVNQTENQQSNVGNDSVNHRPNKRLDNYYYDESDRYDNDSDNNNWSNKESRYHRLKMANQRRTYESEMDRYRATHSSEANGPPDSGPLPFNLRKADSFFLNRNVDQMREHWGERPLYPPSYYSSMYGLGDMGRLFGSAYVPQTPSMDIDNSSKADLNESILDEIIKRTDSTNHAPYDQTILI